MPPLMRSTVVDMTALSYWFPRLEAEGVPVPRTRLVTMTEEARAEVWKALDGTPAAGAARPFFDEIAAAADAVGGFPCFLRTDHTSGKHEWEHTCYLQSAAVIPRHVYAIAEFSACADMMGLPWDVWAVRELLPTRPFGRCPRYGNMPINREFRFFVTDGVVRCRAAVIQRISRPIRDERLVLSARRRSGPPRRHGIVGGQWTSSTRSEDGS